MVQNSFEFTDFVSGGGGGGDEPYDAIKNIRKLLGHSFRQSENEWMDKVRREAEMLKRDNPKYPEEEENEYLNRLEQYAVQRHPYLKTEIEAKTRLAGFVVGHPENEIVKEDIVPKIEFWHHRSGRHVDFVFLGFSRKAGNSMDAKAFNQIVSVFEHEFKWKYSGRTDLILLNIRYDSVTGEAVFDISDVVVLTLEDAIEDRAIRSVSSLIEDIIDVTKEYEGNNPVWYYSDRQGLRFVGSAIFRFILSLLPKAIRDNARNSLHFYVKDLSKKP